MTPVDIQQKRIAVIGLGFVGLPLGATFADIGFDVTGVDASERVRKSLAAGKSHFEEQGLQMLLDRHLGKKLQIQEKLSKGAHDIYIIAVGTPVDPVSRKPIMDYVKSASSMVGGILKKGDLVIMRSTVPVGTTREIVLPLLEQASGMKAGTDFNLVFAPERLVAGRALQELRELPQIIGGLMNEADLETASALFRTMTPVIMDVESIEAAEMAKIIDNSYRDLTFAYANQMARLCECIGIDMVKLADAVNFGYKRNHVPHPSPGVGGTCLTKDPFILLQVGEKYGYEPKLARVAREINEDMPLHVVRKLTGLLRKAGKDPAQSTVLILGFAFKGKPETSDTRDSPTRVVVDQLKKQGCTILGYDPVVSRAHMQEFGVEIVGVDDGFQRADAAVVMTNHKTIEALDILKLLPTMKRPAAFLDGWYAFDPKIVKSVEGIVYGGVGND